MNEPVSADAMTGCEGCGGLMMKAVECEERIEGKRSDDTGLPSFSYIWLGCLPRNWFGPR